MARLTGREEHHNLSGYFYLKAGDAVLSLTPHGPQEAYVVVFSDKEALKRAEGIGIINLTAGGRALDVVAIPDGERFLQTFGKSAAVLVNPHRSAEGLTRGIVIACTMQDSNKLS